MEAEQIRQIDKEARSSELHIPLSSQSLPPAEADDALDTEDRRARVPSRGSFFTDGLFGEEGVGEVELPAAAAAAAAAAASEPYP